MSKSNGKIDEKYDQVVGASPWIGEPIGDEQACDDGKGSFREYQGGASIYYTPATGAHVIYGLIREKWNALGREKGPNGYPITDEADAASGKGRYNNFQNGTIIYKWGTAEAFSVYGAIWGKWGTVQYDSGPLGFPLTDETPTSGNTGRYNDFEHGAIYYSATTGTQIVLSPILEAWSLVDRTTGQLKFPKSDTSPLKSSQSDYTQTFQGGSISCTKHATRSIVTSSVVTPRIEPLKRSLILTANPRFTKAWQQPNIDDTRVCELMPLNRQLQLKTALVIFRRSYTRSFNEQEIGAVEFCYEQATEKIFNFNFGLVRVNHNIVLLDPTEVPAPKWALQKSDFVNAPPANGGNVFYAEFNAYQKVIAGLQAWGWSVDNFDIVTISIPWADTATDKPSAFAWSNQKFRLGNNKTYSTIHYIYPNPYWWAYYVHETTHCIEWMLQGYSYPSLRNPDDKWWKAAYPELKSSTLVPPPENLVNPSDPTDPRLYAMHQRIKSSWFNQSPWPWGQVKEHVPFPDQFLMYSCPDTGAIVETAWSRKYLYA